MNPDVNCDGYVNDNDLVGLLGCFGAEDLDGDGICDGSGPQVWVVDTITFRTDSTFIEAINEWYVFEVPDTTFTFVCANYGCMNPEAVNYDAEAVIDDGSCVMDWMQLGQDIDGGAAGDESGWSVSLSSDGNAVAIGAPDNDGNGVNSRRVGNVN